MPDIIFLLIAGTAVFAGALVQGTVGLGLGLLAAPVVAIADPSLMPGSMLVASMVTPLMTLWSEGRHVDWRGLAWGLPPRIPGSILGAWLVAVLEPRLLGLVVGVMVLLAVAATISAVTVRVTPVSLMSAGMVSGVTGTATSIGGPPLALLYQHSPGPTVRATLGAYFVIGAAISLATLQLGGQLTGEQLIAGAALIPFVVAGYFVSIPVRRRWGAGGIRAALLGVVSLSGVVLIVRALT
ncbi:sulfite exporter TauE/SafE family protein [Streptomyces bohaiensis]|uniref:Probable membrane transporter protein n=1 Tax=Streptomyces bohaiensis TaxID=1431344 RepID=A0ABX1C982_9ACTN|nr:sulfite exporter TauE/SafE family protein [Streptomyces bohaiensis]NJQ15705.1 sulfite exporter TauE/SafE family protein [Streptomyces bohaiensis]